MIERDNQDEGLTVSPNDSKPIVKRSSSPIEKLLIGSVGCVKCGASYGKCDCWYKCKCGWLAEKGCKCSNENCV
jgi:hypothetical protein